MTDHHEATPALISDLIGDLIGDDAPAEAAVRFIAAQPINYNLCNLAATGYNDSRPLAVCARDQAGTIQAGTIQAGLTGFTWGGALKIESLWVQEALRGQGYGSRFMLAAEIALHACR